MVPVCDNNRQGVTGKKIGVAVKGRPQHTTHTHLNEVAHVVHQC